MNSTRRVPPWIFGITAMPFGIAGAFTGTAMPFLLKHAQVPVERIAVISALTLMPSTWQFLWAPIVDLGPRRRTWLVIVALLGAACLAAAVMLPLPSRIDLFVVLAVLGQGLTGLVGSCNGGLMATTLPKDATGRAGGWLNAGNLGGGALGAAVTLKLVGEQSPPWLIGLSLAVMIVAPSLAALFVPEDPRPVRSVADTFGGMLRDVRDTVKSRPGWSGILICLSPVGTAVAINLFSGIADDYHATDNMVVLVNGIANGLLTAGGSLVGGYICDRMDKRYAYVIAGALTAVCGLAMMLAPMTPTTYAVGALVYMLITGFCYAAFSALVLEIIGNQAGAAASTQYTLFTAAGNAAIAYVTWIDGIGYGKFHARGLLGFDAAQNLLGIGVLLAMLHLLRPRAAARPAASTV